MCYIFWNFTILWRAYHLCAYRLYTSWVYGWLGLHCHRVIPAYVVTTISAAFPADHGQYTGFMEASGDDLSMWPWWSSVLIQWRVQLRACVKAKGHHFEHSNQLALFRATHILRKMTVPLYAEILKIFCYINAVLWWPSVLWHCWLGVRKSIRPVKNWVMGHGYLSGVWCKWYI